MTKSRGFWGKNTIYEVWLIKLLSDKWYLYELESGGWKDNVWHVEMISVKEVTLTRIVFATYGTLGKYEDMSFNALVSWPWCITPMLAVAVNLAQFVALANQSRLSLCNIQVKQLC